MCEAIPELDRVVQLYIVQPGGIKLLDGAHEAEANHTANPDVAFEKEDGTQADCKAANESSCEKDGNPIETKAIHIYILEKEAGCEASIETSCEKDGHPIETEAIHTDNPEKEVGTEAGCEIATETSVRISAM